MTLAKSTDSISDAYDRWSTVYETNENATRDLAATVVRRQLLDLSALDVLEIGCGTGLNTRHLANISRTVLAVDFSDGMLKKAQANSTNGNVRFQQLDIRSAWSLADNSFDLVVCTLVLEHVDDLDHVFSEARRVLRPGGEFFFCELHPFRQLQGRQAQFTDVATGDRVLVTAYLHQVSEYLNTAIRQGFKVLRLDEWWDNDEAAESTTPRLLSLSVAVDTSDKDERKK